MSKKNYVRVAIDLPDGRKIQEGWSKAQEEGTQEIAFLRNCEAALSGQQPFIKIKTKAGNIEIVPSEILRKSHVRIEYSRFGF